MIRSTAAAALALGIAVAAPLPAQADPGLSLKPQAGQFVGEDFKRVGAGQAAQAKWTTKEARSGSHSVLLQKSVATTTPAFAAAVVKGAEGMTVEEVGTIGFSVQGPCTGGSPRFNLSYDTDNDGDADGIAFYGCGNHVTGAEDGWTTMAVEAASMAPADADVTSLSVLVDEQGTYFVDDVEVAGETLSGPSD